MNQDGRGRRLWGVKAVCFTAVLVGPAWARNQPHDGRTKALTERQRAAETRDTPVRQDADPAPLLEGPVQLQPVKRVARYTQGGTPVTALHRWVQTLGGWQHDSRIVNGYLQASVTRAPQGGEKIFEAEYREGQLVTLKTFYPQGAPKALRRFQGRQLIQTKTWDPEGLPVKNEDQPYAPPLFDERLTSPLRIGIQLDAGKGLTLASGAWAKTVRVTSVIPETPAAWIGLLEGDTLLAVEGTPIEESQTLINVLQSLSMGARVTLEILRKDQRMTCWPIILSLPFSD